MIRLRWPTRVGVLLSLLIAPAAPMWAQAPSAQVVQLQTADGVELAISYYPSAERAGTPEAKQVTPVVMLHDHKDTRAIFAPLVALLQTPPEDDPDRPSFAVVTVDLRGHGDSTRQVFPNGTQRNLDAAKIDKADVYSMAALDMEEVRRFLRIRNDEGTLNLNKLCLIGAGMGANVAANWAAEDWRVPPLAIGKQGQDVKALVMISPRWNFEGLLMQEPMRLRSLKEHAAWMLIYGADDPDVVGDVRRIEKQLKALHPDTDDRGAPHPRDFVLLGLPTKLQGDSLLTTHGDTVNDQIVAFLLDNVAAKNLPWTGRRTRLP